MKFMQVQSPLPWNSSCDMSLSLLSRSEGHIHVLQALYHMTVSENVSLCKLCLASSPEKHII